MSFKKQGFIQALGVSVYCSLVGTLIWNGNSIFGKMNSFFGPVAFLLLFVTSALICATIVFYKPYKLFMNNKKKEALSVVVATVAWLLAFLVLFFAGIFIFK